jgi:hypothetical protein
MGMTTDGILAKNETDGNECSNPDLGSLCDFLAVLRRFSLPRPGKHDLLVLIAGNFSQFMVV